MQRVLRLAILLAAISVLADQLSSRESVPANLFTGASCEEVARTGWPWCHWKWAEVQNQCDYCGYYVGGGATATCGRERCVDEGTWGWDYQGHKLNRIVRLAWTHPPRRQGGEGTYQPDGPRMIEEIGGARNSTSRRADASIQKDAPRQKRH
jgi:hypothetical protein